MDIAHEHMFSCTTPGVVTSEQAVVVEHMTITTVDCNHSGMYICPSIEKYICSIKS